MPRFLIPPQSSKTTQGYDLQLGTNNVAPSLLTKLLYPILAKTAKTAPPGSVRVVWISSDGAECLSPKGGADPDNMDVETDKSAWFKIWHHKSRQYSPRQRVRQATERRHHRSGMHPARKRRRHQQWTKRRPFVRRVSIPVGSEPICNAMRPGISG